MKTLLLLLPNSTQDSDYNTVNPFLGKEIIDFISRTTRSLQTLHLLKNCLKKEKPHIALITIWKDRCSIPQ